METLASIATFIFFASLKATVVLALVLVAQKVFSRHLSASGRYLLWLAVVISLVSPVGFEMRLPPLPSIGAFPQAAPMQTLLASDDATMPPAHAQAVGATQADASDAPLRWEYILPALWLAGVLVVLAAMAWSNRRFRALARKASPAPESVQAVLRDCAQQAGCTANIHLLASPGLRTPVIAGAFKPVLLWPAGLEALLTPMQLQHVLMHEVMHVKRRDISSACVVAVLQAAHWFNPAIWIAFSWLREDREMACDAATVRTLHVDDAHDPCHDYAHTLIQLGAMRPAPAQLSPGLGILESHAQLRRRIHMLAQAADPTARHFLSGALLLAFSALAFSQPTTAPRATEPGSPLPVEPARMLSASTVAVGHEFVPEPVAAKPELIAASRAAIHEPVAEPVAEMPAIVPAIEPVPAPLIADEGEPTAPLIVPEPGPMQYAPQVPLRVELIEEPAFAPLRDELLVAIRDSIGALPATEEAQPLVLDQVVVTAQATAASQDDEALVCRRANTPGSRVRTRVCMTEEQWDAGYRVPTSAFVRGLSPIDFMEPLRTSMF